MSHKIHCIFGCQFGQRIFLRLVLGKDCLQISQFCSVYFEAIFTPKSWIFQVLHCLVWLAVIEVYSNKHYFEGYAMV